MEKVTSSELTKIISNAINEAAGFQDANNTARRANYMNNTQLFKNYIKEIDQELNEIYQLLDDLKSNRAQKKPWARQRSNKNAGNNNANNNNANNATNNGTYNQGNNTYTFSYSQIAESIIRDCVGRGIRKVLSEDIQVNPDVIKAFQNVIANNGVVSNDDADKIKKGLRQVIGGSYNNEYYQNNYRDSQILGRVEKLLKSMAAKYVEIYRELTNSSVLNEGFGNWLKNQFNNSEFGQNFNATVQYFKNKNNANLKIPNQKEFIEELKETYEGVFRPLFNCVKNGSYINAMQFAKELSKKHRQLTQILNGK